MDALWRFSPDMPCVLRRLADCDRHATNQDRFLRYTSLMGIRVWAAPGSHAVEVAKHYLGAARTTPKASDGHAPLAARYRDWSSTRRAGWPSRCCGPESLPPWPRCVRWAPEVHPEGITLQDIPAEAVFVQDASWYPKDTAGGGVVVADTVTR